MSTVIGDDDYKIMDDVETVTLYQKGEDNTILSKCTVAYSWKLPIRRDEVLADGSFSYEDVIWHLPNAELSNGITPDQGYVIKDASDVLWNIKGVVTKGVGGTDWRVVCGKAMNQNRL